MQLTFPPASQEYASQALARAGYAQLGTPLCGDGSQALAAAVKAGNIEEVATLMKAQQGEMLVDLRCPLSRPFMCQLLLAVGRQQ